MISNSLKVFRKYISDLCKIDHSIIQSIIEYHNLDYTPQDFSKDFNKKVHKDQNYLGLKYLNSLLNNK